MFVARTNSHECDLCERCATLTKQLSDVDGARITGDVLRGLFSQPPVKCAQTIHTVLMNPARGEFAAEYY